MTRRFFVFAPSARILLGKCLGMVIAYSDRTETFAIPAEELRGLVPAMLGGEGSCPAPAGGEAP